MDAASYAQRDGISILDFASGKRTEVFLCAAGDAWRAVAGAG
jgi:hypothetical protein